MHFVLIFHEIKWNWCSHKIDSEVLVSHAFSLKHENKTQPFSIFFLSLNFNLWMLIELWCRIEMTMPIAIVWHLLANRNECEPSGWYTKQHGKCMSLCVCLCYGCIKFIIVIQTIASKRIYVHWASKSGERAKWYFLFLSSKKQARQEEKTHQISLLRTAHINSKCM